MKINDVNVGDVLFTRVSGDMVLVRVVRIDVRFRAAGTCACCTTPQRRVVVRRLDTGRELPKSRMASALHRNPHPGYHGSETVLVDRSAPCEGLDYEGAILAQQESDYL